MRLFSLLFAVVLFLISCGKDWSKNAVVIYSPSVSLRAEPSANAKVIKTLNLYEEVTLGSEKIIDANTRFVKAKVGGVSGWLYAGVVLRGYTLGIVRERAAYKDSDKGVPVGFLEPTTIVFVRKNLKTPPDAPIEIRFKEGDALKIGFLDASSLSLSKSDIEIYTLIFPRLEDYMKKAAQTPPGVDQNKQYELAMAYINEIDSKYQQSEFYPKLLEKKSSISSLLGDTESGKKVLETDTNCEYEVKK
jgi:hypothetical protein